MSNTIEIKEPSKLRNILRIFSALDDARWSDAGNYNLINYCEDDFTPDEKLLTHWLCYITDRQTAFQRVWDVGGYVLSHLVRDFTKRREAPVETVLEEHRSADGKRLAGGPKGDNPRLKFYGIDSDRVIQGAPRQEPRQGTLQQTARQEPRPTEPGQVPDRVEFSSRFMPTDMLSIYRTLIILDGMAERSFTRFIYQAINGEFDQKAVRKLAAALHYLTYADIGTVKEDDLTARMTALSVTLEEDRSVFHYDPKGFMGKLVDGFDPYGKKRIWCSIRDYLKSPDFNDCLVGALKQIDSTEADRWHRKNVQKAALAEMELPGDVWNNNTVFRDGLFSPHLGPIPKSWDMPKTIREIHSQISDQNSAFYPEQLDVTFDFVPRMCGKLKCQLCIFGGGIKKQCHQQRGLYCPVTLAACGYYYPCNPDNCAFKLDSDSVRGICQSSIAK